MVFTSKLSREFEKIIVTNIIVIVSVSHTIRPICSKFNKLDKVISQSLHNFQAHCAQFALQTCFVYTNSIFSLFLMKKIVLLSEKDDADFSLINISDRQRYR